MKRGHAWATTSPKFSCSTRAPRRPRHRPNSDGILLAHHLPRSSVTAATANKPGMGGPSAIVKDTPAAAVTAAVPSRWKDSVDRRPPVPEPERLPAQLGLSRGRLAG